MIVCVCHRISDRDILRHARAGCESFDELQFQTGVSTCCGCCETCARETFDAAKHALDVASPTRSRLPSLPEACLEP
jgi:bacterioferritin-associated ferredoxin